MAKRNAEVVLKYSTLYPFRLRGQGLMCVYCFNDFKDPDEFRSHLDETHKTVDLYLAFAHTKYKINKDYLKVDSFNLKCRLCDELFDTIAEVAQHLKNLHENLDVKDMDLEYEIGLHPYRLVKDKLFCVLCNLKQPSLTNLTRHMSTHYADHVCDICAKSYNSIEGLKAHLKYNHAKKNMCRKCMKDFPTAEERKDHFKTSPQCWGYVCIYCRERFASWERKQKHLASAHDIKADTYPCPDCELVFESRFNFYAHYDRTHSDLALICTHCGMKFGKKRMLDSHMVTHIGVKQFSCTVCSKQFKTQKNLKCHMWTHSETKRHPCTLCHSSFNKKIYLKAHVKKSHPDMSFE